MARVSTLYKNVGDGIDVETASSSLISTLQGFHLGADQAQSVIDKFNEVGNSYAISSAGIGEALQRSASALSTGNNSLSESIALITTAQTVVQDAASVGTGLKTASLRLRGTSISELEALGEDTDGAVESVSKLRDLLLDVTDQKVDIQIDDDTYKSTYQILKEMSDVYSEMSDMNQAAALEAMFGKRQANIGAAILEHGDLLEQVYNTAEFGSEGSAMAENEKYMDSLQGKLGSLKATAQEFSNVTLNSDWLKGAVDSAQSLLEIFTNIAGLGNGAGLLGLIGGGAGAVSFFKNLDWANTCLHLNLLLSGSIIKEKIA